MDTSYVKDDYGQYYLLIQSDVIYPEKGFALIATDGFVFEGGVGIGNWYEVSEYRDRLERLEEKMLREEVCKEEN